MEQERGTFNRPRTGFPVPRALGSTDTLRQKGTWEGPQRSGTTKGSLH